MGRVKKERCGWCGSDPDYIAYHDDEWGMPDTDSAALFELLMLEGMQAGLAWITVLKKRPRMRERFFGFDVDKLARASHRNVESWLKDAGLIRHRGKLEALISNARVTRQLDQPLADLVWSFVDFRPVQNRFETLAQVPAKTETAEALSKHLKQLGYKFVGPTICYAFMQSAGLVNDHLLGCPGHLACKRAGKSMRTAPRASKS